MNFVDKDLLSVQEARILMERAAQAKEALAAFPQEKLDRIAAAMLEAARERLSQMASERPVCTACFTGDYPMEPPSGDIRGSYEK